MAVSLARGPPIPMPVRPGWLLDLDVEAQTRPRPTWPEQARVDRRATRRRRSAFRPSIPPPRPTPHRRDT